MFFFQVYKPALLTSWRCIESNEPRKHLSIVAWWMASGGCFFWWLWGVTLSSRTQQRSGGGITSAQGLKPELTTRGRLGILTEKTYHLILYSECWCGDHGCSLEVHPFYVNIMIYIYIFMCFSRCADDSLIHSKGYLWLQVTNSLSAIQQQHHDTIWSGLQVVPESLLSALSEDSPTREAIGL